MNCKLFRFNPLNYYTHLDLSLAKEYNLSIELIQDGQPNFLYYSKDKLMNGKFLFGHYINDVYTLKEKKIRCAKDLLNVLYGALSEKSYSKFSVDSGAELNITNAKIVSMYSTEERIKFKVVNYRGNWFRTQFARMLPFTLGLGRDRLYHVFKNFQNLIVRAHTDGAFLTEYPKEILTGTKIGQLKNDGYFEVDIFGLNKINKRI